MDTVFDYLTDVILHRSEVAENIATIVGELNKRAEQHDRSKLQEPEFSVFVSTREEFKKVNYGTPEYSKIAEKAKVAVQHHYQNNRHHTAFHKKGINGMNLIDIIEMICDWKAAARRSPDKKLWDTLDYAQEKYNIGDQLMTIIKNTLHDLDW